MTRLLVIEDDEAIAEALTSALEEEGHSVQHARNGIHALDLLKAEDRPDLILLDLMMPHMDGFEFRQRQLESDALASIPTIVLSASGTPTRIAALHPAGFLEKPVHFERLLAEIERHASTPRIPRVARQHAMILYAAKESLDCMLGRFFGAGLARGEGALAIALKERRAALPDDCVFADAEEVLAELLVDGAVDRERFRAKIGALLEETRAKSKTGAVCVFGEMVDLLWARGNPAAATEMEDLWNSILAAGGVSLVCGYSLRDGDREQYGETCARHAAVLDLTGDVS